MKLRRTRGPNCEEACASATTRIEKVTPAIPIVEDAIAEHLARPFRPARPEEPDGIGLAGLPSLVGGDHDEREDSPPRRHHKPGTNQKLAVGNARC